MWKIKKEYHYYPNSYGANQDRYINKGDFDSPREGREIYHDYLNKIEEHYQNFYRGEEPKCPDLVFTTKEEAIEAMGKVAFFRDSPEPVYYLTNDEYARPSLSVKFHRSWK